MIFDGIVVILGLNEVNSVLDKSTMSIACVTSWRTPYFGSTTTNRHLDSLYTVLKAAQASR